MPKIITDRPTTRNQNTGVCLVSTTPASRSGRVPRVWPGPMMGGLTPFGGSWSISCMDYAFSVFDLAVFFFSRDARLADALHAVRTLFHNAAAAHRHVRIAAQFQAGGIEIRKQKEVEPAHLIRTVVRAIARPYTAVVDHVIQAFGRVHGCPHGTNRLARRIFALHARDRLEVNAWSRRITFVIGVD